MPNEETDIQARDRGYNDAVAGIKPKPEDVAKDPYKDGYRLGLTVRIASIAMGGK